MQKGIEEARKNMFDVPLAGSTITHRIVGGERRRSGHAEAGRPRYRRHRRRRTGPGDPWRSPYPRTASRAGSSNGINVAHATIAGLKGLKRPMNIAALRGKPGPELERAPWPRRARWIREPCPRRTTCSRR